MIVEKFKRDRSAAGLPPVWPDDFDEKAWGQQHTRHFEPLKNGQIFDLGGREEEIIFMPGHTKGSIVVFDHDIMPCIMIRYCSCHVAYQGKLASDS